MNVNVKSIYHSTKATVPLFEAQGHGVVVNISSISAPRPRPNLVWYAGSKGAVSAVRLRILLSSSFSSRHIRGVPKQQPERCIAQSAKHQFFSRSQKVSQQNSPQSTSESTPSCPSQGKQQCTLHHLSQNKNRVQPFFFPSQKTPPFYFVSQ